MDVVVRCTGCNKVEDGLKDKLKYFTQKHKSHASKTISEKRNRRTIYDQMRKVEQSILNLQKQKQLHGIVEVNPCVPQDYKDASQDPTETNLRAMMAVYYQGMGPRDIGNTMSFLGIPGGHAFHNLFYKQSHSFH